MQLRKDNNFTLVASKSRESADILHAKHLNRRVAGHFVPLEPKDCHKTMQVENIFIITTESLHEHEQCLLVFCVTTVRQPEHTRL